MKVLNLCVDDWANYSYDNAMALRSIGIECDSYKLNPHAFNYANESQIVQLSYMQHIIKDYDVIQFVHNNAAIFKTLLPLLKGKKVAVYYTGSNYRENHQSLNSIFNPNVDISFTDQCEFMGLGAKDLHYIATAVNTKVFPHFRHTPKQPYVVGHFPSNPEVKGTKQINKMLAEINLSYDYHCSVDRVNHAQQLKRMSACDIYVELFKPELNGRPYGCYGVTAFEAAACGKIVVTQNINKEIYLRTYGNLPLQIANTEIDFKKTMEGLLQMSSLMISELQTETYNWVNQKHSYEATGRHLNKILSNL